MKNYPASGLMLDLLTPAKPVKGKAILDGVGEEVGSGAADYASTGLRMNAAAIVQQFASTASDDLGDDETLATRLLMLVVGAVDADKDGELSEDEQAVAGTILESMWDYLASKGVSEDDIGALLNDWDADAAARVKDLLADTIPTDEGEASDDLDAFAFDEDAEQSVFDSAGNLVLDAVYRKKVVVRQGRKVRVNKRISGVVRLSAKQKVAVRKMNRKAHSAAAMVKRMKSMRLRKQAGL